MKYYCISSIIYYNIIIIYKNNRFFLIEIKFFIYKIEINNSLFYARYLGIYNGLYLETLKIIKNGITI